MVADGALDFAEEHATVNHRGKPIWQFLRYQVKSDQTAAFTMDVLSLPSFTRKAEQICYGRAISKGTAFFMN
ncbi:VirK family protein [Collimonas pratensis]|uniref:VirK family protein n=1 Tax=Collimonas pratensis TaxID=279113 RepID=UPI0009EF00C1